MGNAVMFGCLGLSHTQLLELRDLARSTGHGKPGRSRTLLDNALALRHVAEHQAAGQSFDAAVKAAARADLVSPSILRRAASDFSSGGSLSPPSSEYRGRGNPAHPLHSPSEPTLDMELCIHRALFDVAKQVKHVAVKHIQQQLLEAERIFVGDWTLRRWMHELGYTFDDKTWIGALTPQFRDARIRSYIWQYTGALRLVRAGTHIIVYLDESYIHSGHQMKKGWHPTVGPYKNNETQGDADTGKRLIILHAMTDDGMLEVEDAVGSNFLHEQTPTAQFVFEAASFDDSDYHNSMDGDAFTLWVKNRLLPAFHAVYPGKKMIIVMDNAGYHKPRDFDWITPGTMSKTECASFCEEHGIEEINATRDGQEMRFSKKTFSQRASKHNLAPTRKELQAAVKAHLKQHPGINKTKIDKLLQPLGHSIVWTPPFVPEVQPIELIWAYVKGLVASQYTLKRTLDQTRQQTDDAFDTITAAMIQKRIAHCRKWIDAFLQTEEAGSLKQHGSLEALIALSPNAAAPADIELMHTAEDDGDNTDEDASD